jgi:RNA polymerase sigma-54 factor
MKPSLQLRFSQQLTMTPQLQQAIKLLQLSTLDLQAEIQEALDSNPLLEVDEHNDSGTGEKALETNHSADSKDNESTQTEVSSDNVDSVDALQVMTIKCFKVKPQTTFKIICFGKCV